MTRKRQDFDAATGHEASEAGARPNFDATEPDAGDSDDDSHDDNSGGDPSRDGLDEGDSADNAASDPSANASNPTVSEPTAEGHGTGPSVPFASPADLAGAPIGDRTPAWGAEEVAAGMAAERRVWELSDDRPLVVGPGTSAVLARLTAMRSISEPTNTFASMGQPAATAVAGTPVPTSNEPSATNGDAAPTTSANTSATSIDSAAAQPPTDLVESDTVDAGHGATPSEQGAESAANVPASLDDALAPSGDEPIVPTSASINTFAGLTISSAHAPAPTDPDSAAPVASESEDPASDGATLTTHEVPADEVPADEVPADDIAAAGGTTDGDQAALGAVGPDRPAATAPDQEPNDPNQWLVDAHELAFLSPSHTSSDSSSGPSSDSAGPSPEPSQRTDEAIETAVGSVPNDPASAGLANEGQANASQAEAPSTSTADAEQVHVPGAVDAALPLAPTTTTTNPAPNSTDDPWGIRRDQSAGPATEPSTSASVHASGVATSGGLGSIAPVLEPSQYPPIDGVVADIYDESAAGIYDAGIYDASIYDAGIYDPGVESSETRNRPAVKHGHRWYRRRIRNYGPLLGLIPMALFGALAWALQQFSNSGVLAAISLGLGAVAAPFLTIAGLPFGSLESYRIAVVASIVIWLGIGWWASRRALARPMPSWRTYFAQLLLLSVALAVGVLFAYVLAYYALR